MIKLRESTSGIYPVYIIYNNNNMIYTVLHTHTHIHIFTLWDEYIAQNIIIIINTILSDDDTTEKA